MKSPKASKKTAARRGRPTTADKKFHAAIEGRSYSADSDYWYYPVYKPTASGIDVAESNALQYPAVWACVRVISETVASLPLHVYRRLIDGGKKRASDHLLYQLLHAQPNSEMTSFQWRECAMSHVLLWGNHYSEIEREQASRIKALWPLNPSKMNVQRGQGSDLLEYKYSLPNGETKIFRSEDILHIPGLGFNGVIGYSPIAMAREAIGIGRAAEDFAGRFYSNDATPGGILKHPMKLSPQAHENLKKSLVEAHAGPQNRFKPMILEEGMTWENTSMPLKDAQFLESRKFQNLEICRIFNVPPYKIQDYDRATFSNVEQTAIDWIIHGIRPHLVRFEQACLVKLFSKDEQKDYFVEYLIDGLLRGDISSRYTAYSIGRNWGWLSADDIRELENMNPLPDGQGKMYLVPMNMTSAQEAGKAPTPKPKEESDGEEEEEMSVEEKEELKSLRSLQIIADEKIKGLSISLNAKEAEISHFQEKNGQLEAKNQDVLAKITEKDDIIKSISEGKQKEIDGLTAKLISQNEIVTQFRSEADASTARNKSQDEMIVQLHKEMITLKEQIAENTRNSFNRLFNDAVGRIVRREAIAVRRGLQRKDLASFETYMDGFYRELPEFASNTLQPAITSYAEMVNSTGAINCLSSYVGQHIKESKDEISKWTGVLLHDTTDFKRNEAGIEDCLSIWADKRPERAADSFQAFFATS